MVSYVTVTECIHSQWPHHNNTINGLGATESILAFPNVRRALWRGNSLCSALWVVCTRQMLLCCRVLKDEFCGCLARSVCITNWLYNKTTIWLQLHGIIQVCESIIKERRNLLYG